MTEDTTTQEAPEQRYVGPRLIASIEDTASEHIQLVRFDDGSFEEYNRHILAELIDDAPYDPTTLRDRALKPAVQQVLEVMAWNNIKLEDLDAFVGQIIGSVQHNLDRAEAQLWKRDGEERRDLHARTLRDIDRAMKA